MDANILDLSYDAVHKIGLLATAVVLFIFLGFAVIIPATRSAARARERRMQHENEDEREKTRMLKEERERFDKERHDQWGVIMRQLEVILSEIRLLTYLMNQKEAK